MKDKTQFKLMHRWNKFQKWRGSPKLLELHAVLSIGPDSTEPLWPDSKDNRLFTFRHLFFLPLHRRIFYIYKLKIKTKLKPLTFLQTRGMCRKQNATRCWRGVCCTPPTPVRIWAPAFWFLEIINAQSARIYCVLLIVVVSLQRHK